MVWHACTRALWPAAITAWLLVCAVPAARAAEASYCVTCKNPDQTYLCRVTAGGSRPRDALKLYCVIRTAKDGHHSSCSVQSESSACHGVEKVYSYDGPLPEDIASDPRIKKFTDKIERDQQTFEKPKGDQPKTLVELTGRAVSASRKGLRNARSALGGSSQPAGQPLPGEPAPLNQSSAPAQAPLAAGDSPALSPAAPHPNRAQRTGSAVSSFARKSYHCMLSLFRNCSSETDSDQLQ